LCALLASPAARQDARSKLQVEENVRTAVSQ